MTNGFYISSISIVGHLFRSDARIDFTDGVNIIYGPSNTGKSWVAKCIDYVFGGETKAFPIEDRFGYTQVRMVIKTIQGAITLTRGIGEKSNTIEVASTDPRITSGDYKVNSRPTKTSLPISHVLLKLIGFDDPASRKVIKNKDYDLQALTWRTFWHALYADETRISTADPLLLPAQNTGQTAFKSALATLITDIDFECYASNQSPSKLKQRNNTIIDYLSEQPSKIEENLGILKEQLEEFDKSVDPYLAIDELGEQAEKVEQQIYNATRKGKELIEELQKARSSLSEERALYKRYEQLASSYQARIERIEFALQGHELLSAQHTVEHRPICSQEIPQSLNVELPQPDKEEKISLLVRLADLSTTMDTLTQEIQQLQKKEHELEQRSLSIRNQIEKDLKPQLKNLRSEISKYENFIRLQTRFEEVSLQLERLRREIEERKTLEFPEANYDPLAHIPEDFWTSMSTRLLDTLGACAYPNLKEARYSLQTFDAFVNGKSKKIQGKGYRSFINTAVMLALRGYFAQEAKHDPGLLIIDTPLLGLDDPQMDLESAEIRETIPLALYEHLAGMQNQGQIIIIDNTKFMPDLIKIKEQCNLIQFTKQLGNGRYGLMPDAADSDLADEGDIEHDEN